MTLRTVLPRLPLGLAILAATLSLAHYRYQLDSTVIEGAIRNVGVGGPMVHVALFALGTNLFVPGALFGRAGACCSDRSGEPSSISLAPRWAPPRRSWSHTIFGGGLGPAESKSEAGAAHQGSGGGALARRRFRPTGAILPFNLLNYGLGVTRIRLVDYVLPPFACMLRATLAYTYLGYAGREALSGGESLIREALVALALPAAPSPIVACRQTT
jgi:hypothetical protein